MMKSILISRTNTDKNVPWEHNIFHTCRKKATENRFNDVSTKKIDKKEEVLFDSVPSEGINLFPVIPKFKYGQKKS